MPRVPSASHQLLARALTFFCGCAHPHPPHPSFFTHVTSATCILPANAQEDLRLRNLVQTYGVKRWAQIANELGGRIGKQCRERWTNHLADDISKEPWTEEEDAMLQDAMARFSKKWATIAKLLPGRTENAVKNRYNASIRRNERSQRKNGMRALISRRPAPYAL